ncbi:MAG: hemerythrin domain-containing protein [Bacteroidales bacterium]
MKQSKVHIITAETELAEIVLKDPGYLLFMEHFGIVPPFQNNTIRAYCRENDIRQELFISFYNIYSGENVTGEEDFTPEDLPLIMRFLENSHRYFLDEIYPDIRKLIKLLRDVNKSYEISLVDKFFSEYFNEVKEHLAYEEKTVFPYIRDLCHIPGNNKKARGSGKFSVAVYKKHHNDIEEKLDDLMNLLIKYLPGNNDNIERRKVLKSIHELNDDLTVHQKIEDLVLIPLVEKIENQSRSNNGKEY